MTIHLPEELEQFVRSEVQGGRFASQDEVIAAAVRLLRQRPHGPGEADEPATGLGESAPAHKPIWEVIEEITAGIPDEEFLKLPADGAEQHDHYIYGTPKRTAS